MESPPFMRSALLNSAAVRHGFFGREGGVSGGIYAGLNCGPGSKDDPAAVTENRRRVAESLGAGANAAAIGAAPEALLTAHQHHSADVITAAAPWARENAPKADAIVTRTPGLALGVLTADCAPVLLADADAGVIGAAHAGWRGALKGVIENTVAAMAALGAQPARISAAVGPCIRQSSYQVGGDMFNAFMQADAAAAAYFAPDKDDAARRRFDLPGFVRARLCAAGLGADCVDDLGADTYTGEAQFFSCRRAAHRGEADYGRMVSVIALAPPPGG